MASSAPGPRSVCAASNDRVSTASLAVLIYLAVHYAPNDSLLFPLSPPFLLNKRLPEKGSP
ncbi:hypothetical protein LguiB_036105 [Lonicera macranthoides]